MKFLIADTTDFNIISPHRYIIQIVQVTKNTDFPKLRYSGQKCKLDIAILRFQSSIKRFQSITELFLQFLITDSLQHGLVIFIYQNDHALSCFLTGALDDTGKT